MQLLAGIALIALGLLSGGVGLALMGSGLSIPGLLVVCLGGFLVLSHFFGTKFKGILKIILGLLLFAFGLINLVKGNLIPLTLAFMIIGGFLIFKREKISELSESDKMKKIEYKLSEWEKEYTKPLDASSNEVVDQKHKNTAYKIISYTIIAFIIFVFYLLF